MIQGFKEFIARGNVVDLAVAVVIGAAFSAIVNTVVESLVNPLIAMFFNGDGLHGALSWTWPTLGGGTATFSLGAILAAAINFLAVALVVYLVFVYPMNRLKARQAARAAAETPAEEEPLPADIELLTEIRDLLKAQQPK